MTAIAHDLVEIDWDNPITNGLLFCAYRGRDLVSNVRGTPVSSYSSTTSALGRSIYGNKFESRATTNGGFHFNNCEKNIRKINNGNQVTMLVWAELDSSASFGALLAIPWSLTAWASPYHSCSMIRTSAGSQCRFQVNIGGTSIAVDSAASFFAYDGTPHHYAVRANGDRNIYWFKDGEQFSSTFGVTAWASNFTMNAFSPHILSRNNAATGEGTDGRVYYAMIWNRALSDAELRHLYVNKHALFRIPREISSVNFKISGGGTTITASGISSAEAIGSPTITAGSVSVLPSGVATAEAFGSPSISSTYQISPSGISSAESVGNPTIEPGSVGISPASVGSSEAFGGATVAQGGVFVLPSAIASLEAFGNASIAPGGVFVLPSGISSAEAFGLAVATNGIIIAPSSIATIEAFGLAGIAPGVVVILPSGIQSGESFGAARVGDVVIAGNYGIVSGIVSGIIRELVN